MSRARTTAETSHDASIEKAVNLLSSSSVKSMNGARSNDGPGGKYMYSLPRRANASRPSSPTGTSSRPWKNWRIWMS